MNAINPQAQKLNETIEASNPHILNMLSDKGKGIFFPEKGILAQSADAKGKEINATIGIALEEDGSPLSLDSISELISVDKGNAFPYAPSYGRPDIRKTWKKMIYSKNPGLGSICISDPVVTNALTHGLSMCGYLFGNSGDNIYISDLYWGNYRLIFNNGYGINFITYSTFSGDSLDIDAFRNALTDGRPTKRIVSLNFPNNPTGYTPTEKEMQEITSILIESAEAGNNIVALIDDAYFGLVYENGIARESIFTCLANAHQRILAVKIDGATKEDYVWGFRVGFLTFGVKDGTPLLYSALEAKTAGAIRGNISNSSNLSQSLLNSAYCSENYMNQKNEKFRTLQNRYQKIKDILNSHPEYKDTFTPLPFNSGYFMCLTAKNADAEAVRQKLLEDFSTGIIASNNVLRIAFSSTPTTLLEKLFDNIYLAIKSIQN